MRAQREPGHCLTARGGSRRSADIENKDEALQGKRVSEDPGDDAPPRTM